MNGCINIDTSDHMSSSFCCFTSQKHMTRHNLEIFKSILKLYLHVQKKMNITKYHLDKVWAKEAIRELWRPWMYVSTSDTSDCMTSSFCFSTHSTVLTQASLRRYSDAILKKILNTTKQASIGQENVHIKKAKAKVWRPTKNWKF